MRGMLSQPKTRGDYIFTHLGALHRNPGSAVSIFHGMTDTCSPLIYGPMVLQIFPTNRWVTTYSGGFAWKINKRGVFKNVKADK
jgi:hypothetical protein